MSLLALAAILPSILLYALFAIWGERKISAFIQDRLGPMEVGPKGLLQTLADILKLLQKEDIIASNNHKILFLVAPFLIFVSTFAGFAVMPLGPDLIGANINTGVYYLLAILALDIVGFIFAAWGSNNKFSMIGGMRTVAQMFSYEIPFSLIILAMVMYTQTMNLGDMAELQIYRGGTDEVVTLFGLDVSSIGGFMTWNIVTYPLSFIGFIIFIICALAEANRAPFDLTEAESEIIAGVLTEYSGFRFSVIALAEYAMLLLMGFLGAVLFFGGYATPLPNMGPVKLAEWTSGTVGEFSGYAWGYFWLMSKAIFWVCLSMWFRWTYPRVRIDQLMHTSWKVLTPIALVFVLVTGFYKLYFG